MAASVYPSPRRLNRQEHYSSKTICIVNNRLFALSVFIFTVIIFIAALTTFIICFKRRCIRRLSVESESDGDSVGPRCLPEEKPVPESFPVFVYESMNYNEQRLECAICLSEFEEEEKGRILPACKHSFHVDCIDMWFVSHSTCPLCRATAQVDMPSAVPIVVDT